MSDTKYWIAFNLVPGLGRVKLTLLDEAFGGLEKAWQASPGELRHAGLDARTVEAIAARRAAISPDEEMEKLARRNTRALPCKDPAYPARLKEIYDAPPVLYVQGTLVPEDEWAVAVVGTRRPTAYGREAAEHIAWDLARSRVTVVSGLARGIDAVAHRAALEAGGRTIAVFASGPDIIYPQEHVSLAGSIAQQGALVSEHPLGTQPRADYFPRRNRILSGLSLGVLVVEAGDTSGALITAHWALEQNREVLAVPGSIFSPASRGTNRLIQEGAKLVRHAQDILEELNLSLASPQAETPRLLPADDSETLLLRHLSSEARHIDEVFHRSGLPMATVSSTLSLLELKGLVKQVGGMHYVLTREASAEYVTPVVGADGVRPSVGKRAAASPAIEERG